MITSSPSTEYLLNASPGCTIFAPRQNSGNITASLRLLHPTTSATPSSSPSVTADHPSAEFSSLKGPESLIRAFDALVKAYVSIGNFDEAIDTLFQTKRKRSLEYAGDIFQEMEEAGLTSNAFMYTTYIEGLCSQARKLEAAVGLLDEMKGKKMSLDVVHYTTLIGGYCLQGKLVDALKLFEEIREKGGKVKEAEMFFNGLEEKCLGHCDAMVNGYCEVGNTKEAYELFVKLPKQGFLLSRSSCLKLLSNLCIKGENDKALALFKAILASDDALCKIMYSKLMATFCSSGDMRKAQWVFDTMVQTGITPDVIDYTMMINGYCRVNYLREACEVLKDMKARGIEPDVITYTVLINGHSKEKIKKDRCLPNAKGSKGEQNEVTTLWSEMKEIEHKPNVISYTVLIDCHYKSEDAAILFDEMIDRGLESDNVMYTALLRGYCCRGYVYKAVTLLNDMISRGIQPDCHTMSGCTMEYYRPRRPATLSSPHSLLASRCRSVIYLIGDKKQDDIHGDIQHVDSINGISYSPNADDVAHFESMHRVDMTATASSAETTETYGSLCTKSPDSIDESRNGGSDASSSGSPLFQLRKDATVFVSQTLHKGMLARFKSSTFINMVALKRVLEKENWLQLPPETIQVVGFAGLVGDGAALIVPSDRNSPNKRVLRSSELVDLVEMGKSGFSYWHKSGNPILVKLSAKEHNGSMSPKGSDSGEPNGINNENLHTDMFQPKNNDASHGNGTNTVSEDENEDPHADFIDEDSQLPSRISKSNHSRNFSAHSNGKEEITQTGSLLCLLRLMDKFARLMQKLEIVNVEFFRGICQLFGIFFRFVFEAFGQHNNYSSGKGSTNSLSCLTSASFVVLIIHCTYLDICLLVLV
ncbi:hypothetical protein RHMOL_Rhmol04G0230300 [Rhododendron molle]|uniref:Uncharacterized protein n=1 Tax=Rhododendron molle TaxID=49168 RepID=A0ACC0P3J1_RHOML|nr:hypothetical protein RHMOL_Rhmol04G0230300 [Rhododendron molle]